MSNSNIVEVAREIAKSMVFSDWTIKNKVASLTLLMPPLVFMGVMSPIKILSETYETFEEHVPFYLLHPKLGCS